MERRTLPLSEAMRLMLLSCHCPASAGLFLVGDRRAPDIAAMDLFVAPTIGLLREGR
jgi:hypothetical protein